MSLALPVHSIPSRSFAAGAASLLLMACTTSATPDGGMARDGAVGAAADASLAPDASGDAASADGTTEEAADSSPTSAPAAPRGPYSTDDPKSAVFESALEEADRSCEQDADCRLLQINTACLPHCDVVALRTGTGLDTAEQALNAIMDDCKKDPALGLHYTSPACDQEASRATCRDHVCVQAPAVCSAGCTDDGEECVGPVGKVCERCPEQDSEADGQPCGVLGQHCFESSCGVAWDCAVDERGDYGEVGAQVWMGTIYDCFVREAAPAQPGP